jgi:catechol 2,3-dioxygenase-like lactoylglutathione lyase family enzyme
MHQPVLKVFEINHLALYVADLERSRRFYIDVLGFGDRTARVNPSQAATTHQTMSFLVAGSHGLDLFEVADLRVNGGQAISHMALSVEDDDISSVSAALAAAGVEVSAPTPRNTVFISDPDGYRIEVIPRQAQVRQLDRVKRPTDAQ